MLGIQFIKAQPTTHLMQFRRGRIVRQGDEHTVQAYMPLSQMPTWKSDATGDHIAPRSVLLRVFAVSDGAQSWRVLPGGLARIARALGDNALEQAALSSAIFMSLMMCFT